MDPKRAGWQVRGAAWVLIGFIVLPFLIVVPVSFTDRSYLSMPEHALSLMHYRELFDDADWRDAFVRSLVIATVTAGFALAFGAAAAFGCWRLPSRVGNAVRVLILLPLIVPQVVQGLALYRTWVDLGLVNTYAGIILAHTITAIPLVFIAVSAALANVDPRLEMAARSLGAGTLRTLLWVLVPVVTPGMLSGALFAFVHSFDELIIVLFITTRGVDTLPKRMWMSLEDDMTPVIACVAVILGVLTFALLMLELAVRARAERTGAARTPVAADLQGLHVTEAAE
jgi:putative spermidine/putrescine transport system permease protein